MDEWYLHFWGNLSIKFEAKIKPLLHLIMPTFQGLQGDQEKWVGGGQEIQSGSGERHVPEEV